MIIMTIMTIMTIIIIIIYTPPLSVPHRSSTSAIHEMSAPDTCHRRRRASEHTAAGQVSTPLQLPAVGRTGGGGDTISSTQALTTSARQSCGRTTQRNQRDDSTAV